MQSVFLCPTSWKGREILRELFNSRGWNVIEVPALANPSLHATISSDGSGSLRSGSTASGSGLVCWVRSLPSWPFAERCPELTKTVYAPRRDVPWKHVLEGKVSPTLCLRACSAMSVTEIVSGGR
eukprot:718677-Rhodomonas_salina.6